MNDRIALNFEPNGRFGGPAIGPYLAKMPEVTAIQRVSS
jgi:hypothetical protein